MLGWALLICYSRIYAGVHYPLDLIGGAILGWLVAVGLYKLMMFIENNFFIARSPKIERTFLPVADAKIIYLVISTLSLSTVIMTYVLHHYNYL